MEGLRAVAICLVVAFHAGVGAFSGGYVGVDVFFVLSGFLITGLLVDELRRTGTISIRDFYARRVRRLLPLSVAVLVVTAVLSQRVLPPLDHGGVASDLKAAALYYANWYFAAESTQYMADAQQSPVLHYWSLAVEEQFYVVWPLLLLLVVGRTGLARRSWPVALRRIALALAVLGIGSFALSALLTPGSASSAYFGVHTRAWELAAGAALALARPVLHRVPRLVAVLAGWTGLLLVLYAATSMGPDTPFPGTAAAVPVAGTALLVFAGPGARNTGISRVLSGQRIMYVGRLSYAWYLWHWPLLVLLRASSGAPGGAGDLDPVDAPGPSWFAVAAVVLLSFLLAVASHHLLEVPLRRARWLTVLSGRSLALGAALTATAATASVVALAPADDPSYVTTVAQPAAAGNATPQKSAGPTATPAPTARPQAAAVRLKRPRAVTAAMARRDLAPAPTQCTAGTRGTEAAADCQLGDPDGKRTVALVGDSHALQWLAAFQQIAQVRGWKLYFWQKPACPMVDVPVWSGMVKGPYQTCTAWRESVMERLAALPRLDAVVIGRYAGYTRTTLNPEGRRTTADDVGQVWREPAEDAFAELLEDARSVVVLRDNPWPQKDVPACLSEQPDEPARCAFARADGAGLDKPLYAAERAAAKEAGRGVSFVDLTNVMCPTSTCPVVTPDGVVMYRDDDHLTASYAESLWAEMDARVAPLVSR